MNILPKLEAIEARHKKLAADLSQPGVTDDMEKFTSLNKEYAELTPVVDKFKVYRELLKEREDLTEMLNDDSDADMQEMAEMELETLQKKIPSAEEELKFALIPKDSADDKNVIVEIRAGTGGDEAALFAADLFRMYSMYAEKNRWKVEELSRTETALGGIREIVANIAGSGVFAKMKFESGVHRVQRVPDTETQGRIHTSACTVAVLPEAEEVDLNIEAKDIRIDVFRASGPGGQSVNTTDSAVRITHLPTGIVVSCQDEKSQHKNKEKGMKILFARVLDHERAIVDSERAADRKSQVGSGDRSERIRTYNYPQGRISDHRINLTLYNLDSFMNGDLDEMFNSLIREDQMAKLSALEE